MATVKFELTGTGQARLDRLIGLAETRLRNSLKRSTEQLRHRIAQNAPEPLQEAAILSRSIEGIGQATPFGAPSDRSGRVRFMKQEGQKSVQDAVATDPVRLQQHAQRIIAQTGNVSRLNATVQFSWQLSRKFGNQRRSSNWNNLIVMWEEGGSGITVRPRFPVQFLLPEDPRSGRRPFYRQLQKAIPAFQMYKKGYEQSRETVVLQLEQGLAEAAKRAGGRDWKVTQH